MPQVAADYRINSYFRAPGAVYVNLYIPSTVKWSQGAAHVSLTQTGQYPWSSAVQLKIDASMPADFTLHLRIPQWASGATVAINGKRATRVPVAGQFLALRRRWLPGDRIDLDLPLTLRLEPLDGQHPNIVALLCGPLVLMPIVGELPTVTRAQLLAANRIDAQTWEVRHAAGSMRLQPFTAIADQQYATYLVVS